MDEWLDNYLRKKSLTDEEILEELQVPSGSEDKLQLDYSDDHDVADPTVNCNILEDFSSGEECSVQDNNLLDNLNVDPADINILDDASPSDASSSNKKK